MTDKTRTAQLLQQAQNGQVDAKALAAEIAALQLQLEKQDQVIKTLEKDTVTDPLTGIMNRRGFETELNRTLANARRHGRLSALLFVDMNNFKAINDTFGHFAGDEVLCHVADLLKANIRETDVLARVGGDEFCIILNDIRSQKDAETRANILAHFIQSSPVHFEGERIWIEASIGSTCFNKEDDMIEVISKADSAMYAKKASKNS